MKKALVAGAGAVVLIAILVFVLASNLNAIVAKAIEKYGSQTTQTTVEVSGVDIALREGRGTIRGLSVASPEGYRARTAFALEDITIDIDIKSVREDPIVIEEIRIAGPVVHAELTGTGASNVDELRKRTQASAAQARRGGDRQAPAKAKRIRIERIVFQEGRIELDASALDLGERTVALPALSLADIGGRDGAPPEAIAAAVAAAAAEKAASAIARSEIDRLVKDKLGGSLGEKAKGLLQKLGN